MKELNWLCKKCGQSFNPQKEDGTFSFNCPYCGSDITVPNNDTEKKTPEK